ncbi:hypothetical protein V3N99_17615 [Dermatophilaceae bacterium Soc4.6]
MAPGVIDGTEERALALGGGPDTLVPGYPWQVQSVADTLTAYAAALDDTASCLARIEVTDWIGPTATVAHTRLGQEPTRWARAATSLATAANALSRYAAAFPPARDLATRAQQLYDDYVAACLGIAQTFAVASPTSIGERISLLLAADAHPTTHEAVWAAEALRHSAVDDLARARDLLRTAGDDTAAVLAGAMTDAPEARTFWQGTIRPPGAEGAAHAALDALSTVPGYVGPLAASVNTLWFLSEGRRTEAGWAAAGAVPFGRVAHGVQDGAEALQRARTFATKPDLLARERTDLDRLATDFGLTKIGDQTYRSDSGLVLRPIPGSAYDEGHRLTHLLAHGLANEAKPSHSVFLMGTTDIMELIDRAWARHPPPTPGDPLRFEVDMGAQIGTLGERRVALIVKPGPPAYLISAYPIP